MCIVVTGAQANAKNLMLEADNDSDLNYTLQQDQPNEAVSIWAKLKRNLGGIICIVIVVIGWIVYAELLQAFTYDHLYFIRYCSVSAYSLYIIPWYFVNKHSISKLQKSKPKPTDADTQDSMIGAGAELIINKEPISLSPCSFMQRMLNGIMFVTTFAIFSGYFWYVSLDYTMVAANNTIYQSQCVWVLIFSSCFLKTKVTLSSLPYLHTLFDSSSFP